MRLAPPPSAATPYPLPCLLWSEGDSSQGQKVLAGDRASELPFESRVADGPSPSSPALIASRSPAGEIVCANRTHADTLRREEIGFPIEQSYYGQPAIPSTTAPTPRVALHDPLVQAAIAAVVPGFRFFAELPRNQKSKRGYYSRGMPRVTNMTGRLNRKNEDEQKRRAELISLGWRPDENTYEDGEPTDEVSKWVPGQKGERQ